MNTGFYTIHTNIGGVFASIMELFDRKKHPISFRFSALKAMRDLREFIEVIIDGHIEDPVWISELTDMEEQSTNTYFAEGHVFSITGHRIKVEDSDPSVGVYIVPVSDPSKKVKVPRIVENSASKIVGVVPGTGFPQNTVEIHTQYSGGVHLKNVRIIASPFTVEYV